MDKTIKLACLLAIIIFSSCASRKDFVYLQDMDELQEYPMVQKYEAIIHRDDRLSIIVNSKNPELSLPFNMSGSRSYSVEADGSISNNEVGVLSDEKEKGYLVDINGNIDFPVLGQLHVEGLTRRQLTELIKKRLINEELLKDPMVTVNFLNFKFSVLGEVGHVGTFEVKGDRITLLEALAMAGDLGGSIGPGIVGRVTQNAGDNIRVGMGVGLIFPAVLLVMVFLLGKVKVEKQY